jgi:hypothetical protein
MTQPSDSPTPASPSPTSGRGPRIASMTFLVGVAAGIVIAGLVGAGLVSSGSPSPAAKRLVVPTSTPTAAAAATSVASPVPTGGPVRLGPTPPPAAPTAPPTPTGVVPTSVPGPSLIPGTGDAQFSGALSGTLAEVTASCRPYANGESAIWITGTLNGSPRAVMIGSYNQENGVYDVITGAAGGQTGFAWTDYSTNATYPTEVAGFSAIDWSRGAVFDVHLAAVPGANPPSTATVEIRGSVTCADH